MTDRRDQRAREIQRAIAEILMRHWDPIRVADHPEAHGEYDSYVGAVYRVLANSRSEEELIDCLSRAETTAMGLDPAPREHLSGVASKLLALDISL